jgi:hypothetical protein
MIHTEKTVLLSTKRFHLLSFLIISSMFSRHSLVNCCMHLYTCKETVLKDIKINEGNCIFYWQDIVIFMSVKK